MDSGSSHNFVDSELVNKYGLRTRSVDPLRLQLFDGSSNHTITQVTTLPLQFPSGEILSVDFYVTPLDKSVSAVLGYSWLSDYNPLIDWQKHSVQFRTTPSDRPASDPAAQTPVSPTPSADPVAAPAPATPDPAPYTKAPKVSLIGAAAFARACKLPGSSSYTMNLLKHHGPQGTPGPYRNPRGVPQIRRHFQQNQGGHPTGALPPRPEDHPRRRNHSSPRTYLFPVAGRTRHPPGIHL